MTPETAFIQLLNGLSYGLLLFMLAAGLTLILSLMGVLNFAHASFYMLGAYFGYQLSAWFGYWPAFVLAPLLLFALGAAVERWGLRRVHHWGHVPELLFTFGLSYIVVELVQVIWGRAAVPYRIPPELDGPLRLLQGFGVTFPAYRVFAMGVAVAMLVALWWLINRTRVGLVIRASLTHPQQVEALGHNVPRVQMLVFGGGCALAGVAGVVGGNLFVTEPGMAGAVGAILFVVIVIGGMGSLAGAFIASLALGLIDAFGKTSDASLAWLLTTQFNVAVDAQSAGWPLLKLTVAQLTPVLPFLLLVLILIFRPKGLLGTRED
ncbi:MAG: branched-chain amino acid ABC transporter permease [Betaproteobacteria bacterium]